MSQFPWKPIRLSGDLEQQIDRAFDELIHRQWGMIGGSKGTKGYWLTAAGIRESTLSQSAPGVKDVKR